MFLEAGKCSRKAEEEEEEARRGWHAGVVKIFGAAVVGRGGWLSDPTLAEE